MARNSKHRYMGRNEAMRLSNEAFEMFLILIASALALLVASATSPFISPLVIAVWCIAGALGVVSLAYLARSIYFARRG